MLKKGLPVNDPSYKKAIKVLGLNEDDDLTFKIKEELFCNNL